MNEIAGFRARSVFAPRAPTDLADARQDISDRLLLSMMMDAGTAPGLTSNNPPHNADSMPSCGATAARRTEPGVCAVPAEKGDKFPPPHGAYPKAKDHELGADSDHMDA